MLPLKPLVSLLVLLSFTQLLFGQDYILPEKGDTIKCYITKIKRDTLFYKFRATDSLIVDASLSIDSIKTYDIEYYEVYDQIVKEKPNKKNVYFGMAFGTGWSHRLGKLDPSIPDKKESGYRNGLYLRGQAGLYFKNVGFGLLFNQHQTHTVLSGSNVTTKIAFIAPYFESQSNPINDVIAVGGYLAIGRLKFEEKLTTSQAFGQTSTYTGKGSSIGLGLGSSLTLLLSNNFNVLVDAGVISGAIPEGDLLDNSGNIVGSFSKESASTFNLGIRFRLLL